MVHSHLDEIYSLRESVLKNPQPSRQSIREFQAKLANIKEQHLNILKEVIHNQYLSYVGLISFYTYKQIQMREVAISGKLDKQNSSRSINSNIDQDQTAVFIPPKDILISNVPLLDQDIHSKLVFQLER